MSKERLLTALESLGFTQIDAQVYIFLAKNGPHKTGEIASAINLPTNMVDKSLKELQSIGIIEAVIDYPLEFIAVPFEEVIDLFIEVKREQAKTMKESRKELLSSWKKTIKE